MTEPGRDNLLGGSKNIKDMFILCSTTSVPKYKTFWEFKLECEDVLYVHFVSYIGIPCIVFICTLYVI